MLVNYLRFLKRKNCNNEIKYSIIITTLLFVAITGGNNMIKITTDVIVGRFHCAKLQFPTKHLYTTPHNITMHIVIFKPIIGDNMLSALCKIFVSL